MIVFPFKSHLNLQSGNLSLQNTDECDMKTVMCLQLDALISHFEKYFSEDMEKYNWIRNPFVGNANAPHGFTSLEAEQFIDLTSNLTLKSINYRLAQNLEKKFFSLILLSVGNIVPFGKCISDTKFYKKIFTFDPGSHSLKV